VPSFELLNALFDSETIIEVNSQRPEDKMRQRNSSIHFDIAKIQSSAFNLPSVKEENEEPSASESSDDDYL